MIDATNLQVSAANVTGTLSFGQLPTAVVSANDLSSYATTTALNTEINHRKAQYGTCLTNSTTLAKVVSCTNFELVTGSEITVKFSYANTYLDTENNLQANAITLNVNSTGAKNVYVGNTITSDTNQLL